MIAGSIRTLDVTKLTLETEVNDLAHVFGLQLFGVDFGIFFFRAIAVDGVEHFWKAAA
jgi:hypothetical protein